MQKQHANTDFSSVLEGEFIGFAASITALLLANVILYPNVPVALTDINDALGEWALILIAPDYVGKAGDLHDKRVIIEGWLSENADYVNRRAKGDLTKLEKSGYPISKLASPVGDLLPPLAVIIKAGTAPASFDVNIAVVPKAKGYLFAFTSVTNQVSDPNLWTWKWSSKHTNTFGGFISGTQYKYAACAVGSSNNLFWRNGSSNMFAQ